MNISSWNECALGKRRDPPGTLRDDDGRSTEEQILQTPAVAVAVCVHQPSAGEKSICFGLHVACLVCSIRYLVTTGDAAASTSSGCVAAALCRPRSVCLFACSRSSLVLCSHLSAA